MDYSIRQYREKDLSGVLSSWENASKLAHSFLTDEFLEKERYNIPNVYLPNTDTWIAELDGIVIGFIALMGNEVGALFVEPKFHGNGIGRSLMDKAREIHGDLEVEVFSRNDIGYRFYTAYGFTLLTQKIHNDTGENLLRLRFTSQHKTSIANKEVRSNPQ